MCDICRKKEILLILASEKSRRDTWGMPSDNKGFRRYMAKETYWYQMALEASTIIGGLTTEDGEPLPTDTAASFFRRQRQLHFTRAFGDLQGDMKNFATLDKQPQLQFSAKRLTYRYHELFVRKIVGFTSFANM